MKTKLILLISLTALFLPMLRAQEEGVLKVAYAIEVMEKNSIFSSLLQNSTGAIYVGQEHYQSILRSPMIDITKHYDKREKATVTIFQSEQENYFSLEEQGSELSKELFDQGGDLKLRLLADTATSIENVPTTLYELEIALAGSNIRILIHTTKASPFNSYDFHDLPLINLPSDAIQGFPIQMNAFIQKPNTDEAQIFRYSLTSYEVLDQYDFKVDTIGLQRMPAPF
jgi:hypothetical protein